MQIRIALVTWGISWQLCEVSRDEYNYKKEFTVTLLSDTIYLYLFFCHNLLSFKVRHFSP